MQPQLALYIIELYKQTKELDRLKVAELLLRSRGPPREPPSASIARLNKQVRHLAIGST